MLLLLLLLLLLQEVHQLISQVHEVKTANANLVAEKWTNDKEEARRANKIFQAHRTQLDLMGERTHKAELSAAEAEAKLLESQVRAGGACRRVHSLVLAEML
jgi:hypothetical protein